MSEYDKTRDAAQKVREKYDNTLRNLEDDVTYIVVKDTVEHEDGSATYSFELNDKARDDLANIGLEFILYCAVTRMDTQDALKLLLKKGGTDEV